MTSASVEVLLATYNGARFVQEQIDSILEQTYHDFRILIRDDGSSDDTPEIIQTYENSYPKKITIIKDTNTAQGAIHNFSKLVEKSQAPYIMLSDQDDIWLSEKIELSLKKIQEVEQTIPEDTPVLVHTDLKVVDKNLAEISPSFMQFSAFNPARVLFHNLLVQNVITGSTTIMNRALAKIVTPIPEAVMMHDWWMALAASSLGKIDYLEIPTILYRQHGENALGAKEFSISVEYLYKKAVSLLSNQGKSALHDNFCQAQAFYDRFSTQLPIEKRKTLETFLQLREESFFQKRITLIKNEFYKGRFIQNIGLFLKI